MTDAQARDPLALAASAEAPGYISDPEKDR